jgi:hypothetical protein
MAASYRKVSTSKIREYIGNMERMRKATEGRPGHEEFQGKVKENLKAARDELRRR